MSRKQKKAVLQIGITGGVYLVFRYLLPLVLPFFFSYLLARLLGPPVTALHQRWKFPIELAAGIMLTILAVLCGGLFLWIGGLIEEQMRVLVDQLPMYIEHIKKDLEQFCDLTEQRWRLPSGCLMEEFIVRSDGLLENLREQMMPVLVRYTVPTITGICELFAVASIVILSAIFILKEWNEIQEGMDKSTWRWELRRLTGKLGKIGKSYLKSEGTIFLLTTMICCIGLCILQNPYFILLGILIGFVDLLPVFGSGTILIPWAVICVLLGDWRQAAGIGVLYFICYYTREFLEAKLMGRKLGISPLQMMMALYIGMRLFGIPGLFYGPIGWILIKEIDKLYVFD